MTALISSSTRALDIDSCRQDIEKAAATKVLKGHAMSIRQCLLEVGLGEDQASNKTMQARVRRHVQKLTRGDRPTPNAASNRRMNTVPVEISVSFGSSGHHNPTSGGVDNDEISVLTDASSLQQHHQQQPPLLFRQAAPIAVTPRPFDMLPSSIFIPGITVENLMLPVIPPQAPLSSMEASPQQQPQRHPRVSPVQHQQQQWKAPITVSAGYGSTAARPLSEMVMPASGMQHHRSPPPQHPHYNRRRRLLVENPIAPLHPEAKRTKLSPPIDTGYIFYPCATPCP